MNLDLYFLFLKHSDEYFGTDWLTHITLMFSLFAFYDRSVDWFFNDDNAGLTWVKVFPVNSCLNVDNF